LDNEMLNRLEAEAGELNKIFKQLTAEEVKQIVDGSDLKTGISPVLDKIFGKSTVVAPTDDAAAEAAEAETTVAAEAAAPMPTPAEARAAAQLAQAVTPPTPAKTTTAKAAPKVTPAKTQATSITEMSNDDFIAALNNGSL
jgi:hypothetical protein